MDTEMKELGIFDSIKTFVDALKETRVYQEYQLQKEKVKRFPELKSRIDEYRIRNYQLQNQEQSDNLMEELENLQREFADVLDTPLGSDFLQAELDFCRMMQNIYVYITDEMNFE